MSQTSRDLREGGRAYLYIILGLIGLFAIIGAVWGGSVLFSNVLGSGNAIKQNQSAGNRIEQQATFEDMVTTFNGFKAKIVIAKQNLKLDRTSGPVQLQIDRANLEGLQQECIDTAQGFNANSRKYLARDWKSAGLPANLDPSECS